MVEFYQMWFVFQHSPAPVRTTHFFHQCCSAWIPGGIEALILILEKSSTADMTSSLVRYCFPAKCCCFFQFGEQKRVRWCQIRRIWRVIYQFKATVTHSSYYNHRLVCRSIVLVKQDSVCQFSRPFCKVSSTTFQSPKLLIQCGFIWKETMQLVSGKVEFNACKVSFLWYNSFLVSLWTFQPTLISSLPKGIHESSLSHPLILGYWW